MEQTPAHCDWIWAPRSGISAGDLASVAPRSPSKCFIRAGCAVLAPSGRFEMRSERVESRDSFDTRVSRVPPLARDRALTCRPVSRRGHG